VTWRDTTGVAALPPGHRDPVDRLLVAQARRHGLLLATTEGSIPSYDVDVLRVG